MRAGQVVRLRVNPKDCVSVLDVMERGGINIEKMSFSSIVALALSAMLQGLRNGGTIPDRDGFEYQQMMEPYLRNGQGSKIKIANQIYGRAAHGPVAPGIGMPDMNHLNEDVDNPRQVISSQRQPNEAAAQQAPLSEEERWSRQRLSELCVKKDMAEDNTPGIVWSEADEAEYQQHYKVVYPNG